MSNTYHNISGIQARSATALLAHGYHWDERAEYYVKIPSIEQPEAQGAGLVFSSVNDYAKWIRALIKRTDSLPLATHKELVKPRAIMILFLRIKTGNFGQIVRTGISVLYCRWTTYLEIPLLPRYVTFWMIVRETWSRISAWCVRGGRVFRCGICRGDEGRNNMIHEGSSKVSAS